MPTQNKVDLALVGFPRPSAAHCCGVWGGGGVAKPLTQVGEGVGAAGREPAIR